MTNAYTRGLAEYIADSTFEVIPQAVVEHAKLLILDTIGAGLLGAALPWSERLRATMQTTEAPGDASVWGTTLRFSAPTAAMLNGTAVHGFEIDDVGAGGHNGSVTLPSALALAQHSTGLSGKELINTVVVGIETASRVNRCVGRIPHVEMGFHGPGLMGTFAAAASASRTLRLNPEAVVHALGHAGQQAASLMFTHHGGMGKRLLAGQATRAGTLSALLAAHGFTNADNVFEAEYGGFCAVHTGNRRPPAYDLTQLTRGLGTDYHTLGVNFKMWACRIPNHATLEAIKELRQQHSIPPEEIQEVRIRLGKSYFQNVGWPYTPTTVASAQLNLHYVAAIIVLEKDVFVPQFTEEKIRAPRVLDMVQKINITHDPAMDGMEAGEGNPVAIILQDGTVLEAWGRVQESAKRPSTRVDVLQKFRKMTAAHISTTAQDEMIALCERLETAEDITALVGMLELGS